MSKWYVDKGEQGDIVLSTRVRLARNLEEYPFPCRLDTAGKIKVNEKVRDTLLSCVSELGLHYVTMDSLSREQAISLAERHLISPEFASVREGRALMLTEDETVGIMLCEEDHIRVQVMKSGLALMDCYVLADKIDSALDKKLNFAFDERLGYLTQCPTNLGTGLRASVLLHLPGLVFTRNIQSIMNISPQLGLAIRSVYGDETESVGNLFQISNQLTLGFSEQEILENLKTAVMEIVSHERQARKALALYMKERLEDEVWRSYGTLRYARLLSEKEVLELLSKVRLGIDLELINEVAPDCYAEILISSRTSYLQNLAENENLSKNEIDRLRAEHVRNALLAHTRSQEAPK